MEDPCFYDPPVFGLNPPWQFDSCGDLSSIIFGPDIGFNGEEHLIPPANSTDSSSSAVASHFQSDPLIFTSNPLRYGENLMSCACSSSCSSQLSPLPSHTVQLSPCSSVSSEKSLADVFLAKKIQSFPKPTCEASLENWRKLPRIDYRQIYDNIPDPDTVAKAKEMLYRSAVMRSVNLGPELPPEKPMRKNVKISNDPQTVAARKRRERFSERLRVMQRLVPGGSKMDTATMLEEAANYLKYLKSQLPNMEAHPYMNSKHRSAGLI